MREVVLATRNQGKIREITECLRDLDIVIYSLNDFPATSAVKEDGKNFRENALKKARYLADFTGKVALADDSGLEVEALGGKPGVLSARFAGDKASDQDNNKKLLEHLKGFPLGRRGASFRCVLALAEPSGQEIVIEETCQGVILLQERGGEGFGYDPLFFFPPLNKTFAELTREEKNQVSHRGKALRKLKEALRVRGPKPSPQ
ncbi:MAG: XTP/dITP diphosphatase [Proteobacteria bacterium]|nr:XTP/dITP diphosphatase [Pseudomonadota bacterium]NIS67711.1 XTP/dITP diphosphatase [Pseudomonadota bacterium]